MAQNTGIKIKIKYSPATTQNSENSDPPKVVVRPKVVKPRSNRRPFKGHGWSGSKKQRRMLRENNTKSKTKYYVVHIGRKPGIYETWAECEDNVKGYTDAHYKAFDSHVGAIDWLRQQRSIMSVQNMMRQHNAEAAQSACDTNNAAEAEADQSIPVAKATPIPVIPTATAVHVDPTPPTARERDFSPVAELARLIANSPVDGLPSPPACTSPTCPYTCGEILHVQKILLQRLYQTAWITGVLSKEHRPL